MCVNTELTGSVLQNLLMKKVLDLGHCIALNVLEMGICDAFMAR